MGKMKEFYAETISKKEFLDRIGLEDDPREKWGDDELEPLRSICCDAPVSIIENHYICTNCKTNCNG